MPLVYTMLSSIAIFYFFSALAGSFHPSLDSQGTALRKRMEQGLFSEPSFSLSGGESRSEHLRASDRSRAARATDLELAQQENQPLRPDRSHGMQSSEAEDRRRARTSSPVHQVHGSDSSAGHAPGAHSQRASHSARDEDASVSRYLSLVRAVSRNRDRQLSATPDRSKTLHDDDRFQVLVAEEEKAHAELQRATRALEFERRMHRVSLQTEQTVHHKTVMSDLAYKRLSEYGDNPKSRTYHGSVCADASIARRDVHRSHHLLESSAGKAFVGSLGVAGLGIGAAGVGVGATALALNRPKPNSTRANGNS